MGNIDSVIFKPLVETYLGSLPSTGSKEEPADLKYKDVRGFISKELKRGIEPKSSVAVAYVGDMDWNRKNEYIMQSLIDVLKIKLKK